MNIQLALEAYAKDINHSRFNYRCDRARMALDQLDAYWPITG
jgi:hypothetical protein